KGGGFPVRYSKCIFHMICFNSLLIVISILKFPVPVVRSTKYRAYSGGRRDESRLYSVEGGVLPRMLDARVGRLYSRESARTPAFSRDTYFGLRSSDSRLPP